MAHITKKQFNNIYPGDKIIISMDEGRKPITREVKDFSHWLDPRIMYRNQKITIDQTRILEILPKKGTAMK